ncbi:MAG: hypothetical protein ACLFN0_02980 [Thermovirgaceae bacterium]
MEKRFRRVQRWLERCIEACKKEKWSNAVADVECARAELDAARDELWTAVAEGGRTERAGKLKRAFPLSLRSVFLAVTVIMAAAIPLSTGTVFVPLEQPENKVSLEWVTPDEKSLLTALRKNLSDMNSARNEVRDSSPPLVDGGTDRQVARTTTASGAINQGEKKPEKQERQPSEKAEVTFDEILSLYEIGHRALRTDSVLIEETNR